MKNPKEIIKELPVDFAKHCTRGDISLLSCSIFGETYANGFEEEFGLGFSSSLWLVNNGQLTFYRSEKEHWDFSKQVGEICKTKVGAKKLSTNLVDLTDWFKQNTRSFNTRLSAVRKKDFFDHYRRFFAYHQGVSWAADYLQKLNSRSLLIKGNIKLLDQAYRYNERIVPLLERKFRKLRIDSFLHDEVVTGKVPPFKKSRALLYINNERIVVTLSSALAIGSAVDKKCAKNLQDTRVITGLGVEKGKYVGRVKKVLDYKNLSNCPAGVVLVVPSTLPQYNKYLAAVGAIVADYGNLLCHASILAREYHIPAVVGTKIATQVLKDGDIVEVDGSMGIVKKRI